MNKLTKLTFGIALNAICAVVGLGIAANANGAGIPCNQPELPTCYDTCGGILGFHSFNCCSTYGTSCCRRQCEQVECLPPDNPANPCNQGYQMTSTSGSTSQYSTCTVKDTCLP